MTTPDYPTSYFSAPSATLDPKLFQGRELQTWVRQGIIALLMGFLNKKYRHPELWAHAWLAGSGVSYQWSADREPADLDCLVGVNYEQFRKANPEFRGLSDTEISEQINEDFRIELQPQTDDWNGFELTFYVNPGATDIKSINPYAAYDLKYNEWTVYPQEHPQAPNNPAWDTVAINDLKAATTARTRFQTALQDAQLSHNDANKRNAEVRMSSAAQQAISLYDEIHNNRSQAFSPNGEGYADFHNYRWQAGKRSGAIQTLKEVRGAAQDLRTSKDQALYGTELPDVNTLIRRAATYRSR